MRNRIKFNAKHLIKPKSKIMGLITQLAFYPTLGYNMARNYWNNNWWPWYSRIDDTVILGALPFKSMIPEVGLASVYFIITLALFT